MDKTIDFYNRRAQEYYLSTVNEDMSACQETFIANLPAKAKILDLGCGSGRDSKHFLNKGFDVEATDGSIELCKLAEKLIGQPVICEEFSAINKIDVYDGVWACASILHLPPEELKAVIFKIWLSLKNNGIFYSSFKYGNGTSIYGNKFYIDKTDATLRRLLLEYGQWEILKSWVTEDTRKERKDQLWINMLARKIIK